MVRCGGGSAVKRRLRERLPLVFRKRGQSVGVSVCQAPRLSRVFGKVTGINQVRRFSQGVKVVCLAGPWMIDSDPTGIDMSDKDFQGSFRRQLGCVVGFVAAVAFCH